MDIVRFGKTTARVTGALLAAVAAMWAMPALADTVTYIHTDALGSVVAETDEAGNVIKRYVYEPYGAVVGEPAGDGPGYTGHVSDASTGLTYMQQRYYDPEVGGFLSVDPVTAYGNPVGAFGRYRYANSNPLTNLDPDGRSCTGSRVRSVCESGGPTGMIRSLAGAGAARQANLALKSAGAFRSYESRPEMYREWAQAVEPVSESWGFEIASLLYKAGGGRYRFGAAHSDGNPTNASGVFDGADLSLGVSGFIHTHPKSAVMSSADVLISPSSGLTYSGGPNSFPGDLTTAVNYELDAVMVRNGNIYEFSYDAYKSRFDDKSDNRLIRLGDIVKELP